MKGSVDETPYNHELNLASKRIRTLGPYDLKSGALKTKAGTINRIIN